MLDESKVFDFYGEEVPEIPDLWTFTVEKAYPIPSSTKGARASIGWKTFVWNGQRMEDIDIGTLIQFTNVDSKKHFENQHKIVENTSNLASKLTFCAKCRSHVTQCVCDLEEHKVEYVESSYTPSPMEQSRNKTRGSQRKRNFTRQAGVYRRDDWSFAALRDYFSRRTELTSAMMYDRLEALYNYRMVSWFSFIPSRLFSNRYVRFVLAWFYYRLPAHVIIAHLLLPLFLMFLCFAVFPCTQIVVSSFGVLSCISCIYTWRTEVELLLESVSRDRTAEHCITAERKRKVAYLLAGCTILTGVYTLVKSLRNKRELFTTQGMMHPTAFEIDHRDANDLTAKVADEQNWANVHVTPVPVSHRSKTTTYSDLKNMAVGNTTFMSYEVGGKHYGTDAFFVCSNVALIPRHAWKNDNMLCKFTRHSPHAVGGNFHSYVSRKHSVDIEDMDASLVWIPNGGSWKDLRDFFPQSYPTSNTPCEFLWKDDLGVMHRSGTLFRPQKVNNGFLQFPGGKYDLKLIPRLDCVCLH
jgi:hypothetical protein